MKKRIFSIILTAAMLLSVISVCTASVSATNTLEKTYEEAVDGDLLYDVLFNQTEGVYTPGVIAARTDDARNLTTVSFSDEGKTVTIVKGNAANDYYYWGGDIEGLKIAEGNKYTIEMDMKVVRTDTATSTGNAGVYFNATDDPDKLATSYNYLFGYYGTPVRHRDRELTANNTLALAGGKLRGYYNCDGDNYVNNISEYQSTESEETRTCKISIEVDGTIYRVFLNGVFFDESNIGEYVLTRGIDSLGISFYLYNQKTGLTISNAKVYKGNILSTQAGFTYPTRLYGLPVAATEDNALLKTYEEAAIGDKLADILFDKNGIFTPNLIRDAGNPVKITVSGGGTQIDFDKGGDNSEANGATYWGGSIADLKITADSQYTFFYKFQSNNGNAGVYINFDQSTSYLPDIFGFYGNFTSIISRTNPSGSANPQIALQNKSSRLAGTFATNDYVKVFDFLGSNTLPLDGDGYVDVIIEVDGYKVSAYYAGKLFNTVVMDPTSPDFCDDLGLGLYIFNYKAEASIKDVALYKGNACAAGLLNHVEPAVLDEASVVDPSCTDGFTGNMVCAHCRTILTPGTSIPATEQHNFQSIILDNNANLQAVGDPLNTYYKVCRDCHEISTTDTFMTDPLNPNTGDSIIAWILAFVVFAGIAATTIIVFKRKKSSVK